MLDFSFLRSGDYITIDNKPELNAILSELEDFGILWMSGHNATDLSFLRSFPGEDIRFVRFIKPNRIVCSTSNPKWDTPFKIYKASDILSSVTQEPEVFDPEEIDIRQFLIS